MGGLEGGIERDSMKNLKKMGGRRGVGNPVCPPEGPRSGRRSLWANVGLSMPLSRWGRVSPLEPVGFTIQADKKNEPEAGATVLAQSVISGRTRHGFIVIDGG